LRDVDASYQVLSCEHDAEAGFLLAGGDFPYLSHVDATPRRYSASHPQVSLLAAQGEAVVASDVSITPRACTKGD